MPRAAVGCDRCSKGTTGKRSSKQIAFNEPQSLQKINPAIPHELETIVLKSIEKNAHERYATTTELADDLRPLPGRQADSRQKAHRSRAALHRGAGAIARWSPRWCSRPFSTFIGLDATTCPIIWHEKQLTHEALVERAKQELQARANAATAQEQRRRAVMNFDQEHRVLQRMLLELQDRKWSQVPQINDLRRAVAEDVLSFLKERLQEGSIDPDIQRETGWSYTLMGHVYRAQGDLPQATAYYDKAIAVLALLVNSYPHNVSNRQELALAYNNRGLHFQYSGDNQHAREQFQKATENYAKAVEECPGTQVDFTFGCPYARSFNNYATVPGDLPPG